MSMERKNRLSVSFGTMVTVLCVGTVLMMASGCADKASTPPMTQVPTDQMYKQIQADQQKMAQYRMSHPSSGAAPAPAAAQ